MMDLVLVRHAIAEEREVFARTGKPDHRRPLTPRGKKRMRLGAAGLRRLVPAVDLLASSPFVRAIQTAEIISDAYGGLGIAELADLKPEATSERLLHWLQDQKGDSTIMVVGHEPSFSMHVSWFTARADEPFLDFKKGGACLLTFYDEIYSGGATLRWLLSPAILRALGD
jgi:phosphohistidine phosphatase